MQSLAKESGFPRRVPQMWFPASLSPGSQPKTSLGLANVLSKLQRWLPATGYP